MKKSIIIISLLFAICENVRSQEKKLPTNYCINTLKHYSRFWIDDSLGKSGFRYLLANEILDRCGFKGMRWDEVLIFMGKPNATFTEFQELNYRYYLSCSTDDCRKTGSTILNIFVKNAIITLFRIILIDG